jgi:hypothetical protein
MIKIKVNDPGDIANLMDAAAYEKYIAERE